MKKIMFNDRYGLTKAVLEGRKTMTRRLVPPRFYEDILPGVFEEEVASKSYYKIGEVVAVAQAYKDIIGDRVFFVSYETGVSVHRSIMEHEKGWSNKQNVASEFMPHRIRITGIKVERLQDISEEDCLREGIDEDSAEGSLLYWWSVPHEGISWEEYKKRCYELSRHEYKGKPGSYYWETPQEAFACLIDKVSGKGTWNRNPYVFAYTFELVKGDRP